MLQNALSDGIFFEGRGTPDPLQRKQCHTPSIQNTGFPVIPVIH